MFGQQPYRNLLGWAAEVGFSKDCGLPNAKTGWPQEGGNLLLRHDVDADLWAAVTMAELEAQLGFRSAFFIMTQSPVYNVLSHEGISAVKKIASLGHDVGLHFDGNNYEGRSDRGLANVARAQANIISQISGSDVTAVSFHQPATSLLEKPKLLEELIDVYEVAGRDDWTYISDSNRDDLFRSKVKRFKDQHLREGRNLQLLIHPMWWMYQSNSVQEIWEQVLIDNFKSTERTLLARERAYGPPRKMALSPDAVA